MTSLFRLFKSFSKLLFPVGILLILTFLSASVWLAGDVSNPPQNSYIVTPEKYGQLSTRGAKVTDEKWQNKDGSSARGWLLRGAKGAPAVILLHRYGADRSWVLNLGVKMNETTDFTILMPDQRGHGNDPLVKNTYFGGNEKNDVASALEYLRSLKAEDGEVLVGQNIGIFGVELGAYAGLMAASQDPGVKALALDSLPRDSGEIISAALAKKYPFGSSVTSLMANGGTYIYYFNGGYERQKTCDAAKTVNRKLLLLAGLDMPEFHESTSEVAGCFQNQSDIEKKLDLNPSGYNIVNASLDQAEAYDQRVIDFFKRNL